jgi:hypothetical protein
MRAAWHRHAGMSQTKALRPMIKRGWRGGDAVNYPSIRTPHLTSVPFHVSTEEVQERNL